MTTDLGESSQGDKKMEAPNVEVVVAGPEEFSKVDLPGLEDSRGAKTEKVVNPLIIGGRKCEWDKRGVPVPEGLQVAA